MSMFMHLAAIHAALPVHPAGVFLAQQSTDVNTNGLQQFIKDNGVFTLLIVIACALLAGALRGNASRVLTIAGLTLFALAFVALGGSHGAVDGVGKFLWRLVGVDT